MRLFWELIIRAFQRQLTYREAALAGLATNFFFGLLRAAVLTALYGAQGSVSGISLQAAVTFTGLTQACIDVFSIFGWRALMDTVYTGDVASDLLKPMGYFRFWMAQDLGRAAASFLMRSLTIMLAYAIFFRITTPASPGQWLAFILTFLLGWLLSFCWRFMVNLASFWTPNAQGIARTAFLLGYFFSGFLMPLRFFPDWFVKICYLTPYPHMVNTMVETYLGVLQGQALVQAILMQAAWIAALIGLNQILLRAGFRKLVIQGG